MKGVAIKSAKRLEIVELEKPISQDGKVIIDVKSSGICGSDIHYWEAGGPVDLVMGHEFCGVVTDAGARTDLSVGDRVTALPISPCGHCEACKTGNIQYCPETWNKAVGLSLDNPGGFTSTIAVRGDMVIKVPDPVSNEEGAMVEPTAVALHAINLANITGGEKVLVVGGGVIGLLSAAIAKLKGASYIAVTETNPLRGEKSVKLGVADEWFNAMDENLPATLMAKTNGGFDKVIECCGNAPAVTSAITFVKPGGQVILVGVSLGPITIPTVSAVLREVDMQGAIAYNKEEFAECIDLIANKKLDVLKFVDDIVGLDEVQASFERLTSGKDDAIKILVDPLK